MGTEGDIEVRVLLHIGCKMFTVVSESSLNATNPVAMLGYLF
jgi:hypothetical protein